MSNKIHGRASLSRRSGRWAAVGRATGRGLLVAVVDSGIAAGHPHVGPVAGGVSLRWRGERIVEEGAWSDRIGHGTACAGVIRGLLPDADLLAVRVFGDELSADLSLVAAGIRFAVERGARLINLSLAALRRTPDAGRSAADRAAELAEACRAAVRSGAAIIAARPPGGVRGPLGAVAGRREVLLAAADPRCPADRFYPDPRSPRAFRTSPFARPIPGLSRERNFHGPSLAAARLTGFAGKILGDPSIRTAALCPLLRQWGRRLAGGCD